MILVDSSVWIEHFKKADSTLSAYLRENLVCSHDFILGELACGSLKQRDLILPLIFTLPRLVELSHEDVMMFISRHKIFGLGIGWIDAHLLATCSNTGASLWTNDKSLRRSAKIVGCTLEE